MTMTFQISLRAFQGVTNSTVQRHQHQHVKKMGLAMPHHSACTVLFAYLIALQA